MDLGLATLLSGGASTLAGLFSGGGDQGNPGYPGVMVLPEQRTLLQDMLAKYYLGQGDYGQAGAMREGRDTLYNEAAAAGIPVGSGVVKGALANRFGQAAQQSAMQRMLYGLQLAQASPAFANTTENFGYSPNVKSPYNYSAQNLANPDLGRVRWRGATGRSTSEFE